MARSILLLVWFFAFANASAEDGLAAQIVIEKRAKNSQAYETYSNSILMAFNSEVSGNLDNYYYISLKSGPLSDQRTDLLVTLKDLQDGKPYYIGSKPVAFEIGEKVHLIFELLDFDYKVSLDTAYGRLDVE